MDSRKPQLTIRDGMLLIAIISGVLAMAVAQIRWDILDARRCGSFVAGLRFVWLWVGLVGAAFLFRQAGTRLIAYGLVLLVSLAIHVLGPSLSLGYMVDLPAYFDLGTFLAACSLVVAGAVVCLVSWWMAGRAWCEGP